MRFAGQRFRNQEYRNPNFRAQRAQAESGSNPYENPTGTRAMTQMGEVNAASMSKTKQRDMSYPDFNIGSFSEPEFKHQSRI